MHLPFQTECDYTQLFTISNPGPSGRCICTRLSNMNSEDDQTDGVLCSKVQPHLYTWSWT